MSQKPSTQVPTYGSDSRKGSRSDRAIELPDLQAQTVSQSILEWVGMEHIDLMISDSGELLPAKGSLGVSLDDPSSRGIHMSRLYEISQDLRGEGLLSSEVLKKMSERMLVSQQGLSKRAEIRLDFKLPYRRAAISGLGEGLRLYPCQVKAILSSAGKFSVQMQVNVQYSSTCPQSKALSEFVLLKSLKDCLLRPGNTAQPVDLEEVLKFIEERGLPATPHAQRSKLTLWGELLLDQGSISLLDWLKEVIEELEFELKTPVQTWVKKADEMAFAEQNAKHTKFCEDAARTILTWFRRAEGSAAQLKKIRGKVIHFESLHPFNAVARFAAKS